jgi:hypothetical protein
MGEDAFQAGRCRGELTEDDRLAPGVMMMMTVLVLRGGRSLQCWPL